MAADVERVHLATRGEWRAWLAEHHADSGGVHLVSWRTPTGRPAVSYEDAVCEALCFGWVDSVARRLDEERTMLYFSPRKPRSGWARTNKARVERLRAEGRMAPAGEAAIAVAVANGGWTLLDDVEELREPDDLRAALDALPPARGSWEAFPPSARRGMLEWLVQARTTETRERRVTEIASWAAEGVRAYPRPRSASTG